MGAPADTHPEAHCEALARPTAVEDPIVTGFSTHMIGRDAELAVLRGAFEEGREGHPRVVVLRGEAGIGKTRLLHEFLAEAGAATGDPPVVIATGQCIDIGEIGAPFTPIRRLLRELYRGVGAEEFRDAAQTPTMLATVASLVPDLVADGTTPETGTDLVTEAIERLLESLSASHHLVLVIEDLHWADAATLALLKTLSITQRGAHVTMVMTYRSDDVGRGHPLRALLADLDRNRAVTTLDVSRLSADDTTTLLRGIRDDLDGEALDALVARSGGVPFFVEELVDLDGDELPQTLRGLVLARWERLSDTAADVVGVMSAGGVRVDHALLEEIHQGDPGALRDGLREALAANVLVSDDDGYSFRHALIQESVLAELLPSERGDLHLRYAAALERRVADGHSEFAGEAAEHWLAGRDIPRAFDATVVAREHAQRTHAVASAVNLGERILALWPQVPDAEARAGFPRHEVSIEVAREWRTANDPARSLRVLRDGLSFTPREDSLARARLHHVACGPLTDDGRRADSLAEAEQGLRLLEGDERPAALAVAARLLMGRAMMYDDPSDAVQRREMVAESIALAERCGEPDALGTVIGESVWILTDLGELEECLIAIERARALDVPLRARLVLFISETDILVRLGRYDEAITRADEGARLAAEVGLERGMGAILASNRGEAELGLGLPRAVDTLDECFPLLSANSVFRSFVLRLLACAHSWDDRGPLADDIRRSEAPAISEVCALDREEELGWVEADLETTLNRLEASPSADERARLAGDALDIALSLEHERLRHATGTSRRTLPGAARAHAEGVLAGLPSAELARLAAVLEEAVDELRDDEPAAAIRALVAAESARAASGGAEPWRVAVDTLEDGGIPIRYLHYARFRLAEALVASGEKDAAALELTRVIDESPSQATTTVARWARDLASRAGIAVEGAPAATAEATGIASLTSRELQVLALVAEGLTNSQIGARLFISPKTVSVHVSAVLTKTGATNRTEAAALYSARRESPASTPA